MALLNLANLYSRKGRWEEAEEMCRRFEAEEPSAIGMVLLARCLRAQGRNDEATEALFDAFNRFGSDLASFDETTFSWYQAAATMSADPVHRRLAAEEEARRKAGPLRPDEDDGHLPRLESDPR
jgi:hypothetical protein